MMIPLSNKFKLDEEIANNKVGRDHMKFAADEGRKDDLHELKMQQEMMKIAKLGQDISNDTENQYLERLKKKYDLLSDARSKQRQIDRDEDNHQYALSHKANENQLKLHEKAAQAHMKNQMSAEGFKGEMREIPQVPAFRPSQPQVQGFHHGGIAEAKVLEELGAYQAQHPPRAYGSGTHFVPGYEDGTPEIPSGIMNWGFNHGAFAIPQNPEAGPSDTVPAMLTPGEAVIPKEAAQDPKMKPLVHKLINYGRDKQGIEGYSEGVYFVPGYAEGTPDADPSVFVPSSGEAGYNRQAALDTIARHEGFRADPYTDTVGLATVGYGKNLGVRMPTKATGGWYSPQDVLADPKMRSKYTEDQLKTLRQTVSEEDARKELGQEHDKFYQSTAKMKGFYEAPPAVQQAMVNMTYNMGPGWHKKWPSLSAAMASGDYNRVADEMAKSKWAGQVKGRADELIKNVRGSVPGYNNGTDGVPPELTEDQVKQAATTVAGQDPVDATTTAENAVKLGAAKPRRAPKGQAARGALSPVTEVPMTARQVDNQIDAQQVAQQTADAAEARGRAAQTDPRRVDIDAFADDLSVDPVPEFNYASAKSDSRKHVGVRPTQTINEEQPIPSGIMVDPLSEFGNILDGETKTRKLDSSGRPTLQPQEIMPYQEEPYVDSNADSLNEVPEPTFVEYAVPEVEKPAADFVQDPNTGEMVPADSSDAEAIRSGQVQSAIDEADAGGGAAVDSAAQNGDQKQVESGFFNMLKSGFGGLKDILGLDDKELMRMAVMAAGSRMLGYNNKVALGHAFKTVSAQAQARRQNEFTLQKQEEAAVSASKRERLKETERLTREHANKVYEKIYDEYGPEAAEQAYNRVIKGGSKATDLGLPAKRMNVVNDDAGRITIEGTKDINGTHQVREYQEGGSKGKKYQGIEINGKIVPIRDLDNYLKQAGGSRRDFDAGLDTTHGRGKAISDWSKTSASGFENIRTSVKVRDPNGGKEPVPALSLTGGEIASQAAQKLHALGVDVADPVQGVAANTLIQNATRAAMQDAQRRGVQVSNIEPYIERELFVTKTGIKPNDPLFTIGDDGKPMAVEKITELSKLLDTAAKSVLHKENYDGSDPSIINRASVSIVNDLRKKYESDEKLRDRFPDSDNESGFARYIKKELAS